MPKYKYILEEKTEVTTRYEKVIEADNIQDAMSMISTSGSLIGTTISSTSIEYPKREILSISNLREDKVSPRIKFLDEREPV